MRKDEQKHARGATSLVKEEIRKVEERERERERERESPPLLWKLGNIARHKERS
jgi:hypothetical protein